MSEPMTFAELLKRPVEQLTHDDMQDLTDALIGHLDCEDGTDAARRLLAALRAPVPEARAPLAWRTIDSIPHNRACLVFYLNALGHGRVVKAAYYDAGRIPMSDDCEESSVREDGTNVNPGWWEQCESLDEIPALDAEPTHWMPLPDPPSAASSPDKEPR